MDAKAVGAFETQIPPGGAARRQVVTRVDVEQASKDFMREPTGQSIGGRPPSPVNAGRMRVPHSNDPIRRSRRGTGDGMATHGRRNATREPSSVGARASRPDAREG